MQAEIQQICTDRDAFQAAKDELRANVKNLETQVRFLFATCFLACIAITICHQS